jgi:hypothetical protein
MAVARTRARVRARMSLRVGEDKGYRHSAHRCADDRLRNGYCRQLEIEALARRDALGHYDAHDALRRVDLNLAWGEERGAQNAHGYTMHWAVSSGGCRRHGLCVRALACCGLPC